MLTHKTIVALNLSANFMPTLQFKALSYEMFTFPGGEEHIKILDTLHNVHRVYLTQRVNGSIDFMRVLMAHDALKRKGVKNICLVMPYIPYARQDRVCDTGEAFSLKVFAKILNSAKFEKVFVLDPHSNVAPALINNCDLIEDLRPTFNAIQGIITEETKTPLLIIPDTSANKKVKEVNKRFNLGTIQCDKTRDPKTGKLTGFKVFEREDFLGRPCIMVDDICDGGGTFIGLAKELKKMNAGNIYLYVNHGIFSKGFDELDKHFTQIYCTNSIRTIEGNDLVTQYEIDL